MVGLLARIFIQDPEDVTSPKVRQAYGILTGSVGIVLNLLLFLGKFFAGIVSHSISIAADAFNNLSDAGSSCVTLIGFKLAGAKPDPEHPFGHGRMEYVAGLAVSGVILVMAFELVRDSIAKILHPQPIEYHIVALVILVASILVKVYMYRYNTVYGKKIQSATMRATAIDSLSDTVATTAVLLSAVIERKFGFQIDGYCGLLVGLFIFYSGVSAAKETLDPLLGQRPSEEFVKEIQEIVLSEDLVQGFHDLVVHDYGPGRVMISLHAEVPAQEDILKAHDCIDLIEKNLKQKLKCDAVIHMDPIVTLDEESMRLKEKVYEIARAIDERISIHDFRMVVGPTHTNMIFDAVVPFECRMDEEEVKEKIQSEVWSQLGEQYFTVIDVDRMSYL